MINAGASPQYASEVAKRIEAEDSQRKRIADLAFKVLKGYRAAAVGAGPAVEFGSKLGVKEAVAAGGAAAAYDYLPPDPADVVKDLVLAQKSQYNDSVNHWRETQTVERWTKSGAGVSNPT